MFSLWRWLFQLLKEAVQLPAESRHWIFGRIIVPGITLFFAGITFMGLGPYRTPSQIVAIEKLQSVHSGSDEEVAEGRGLLLILDSGTGDLSFPWITPGSPGLLQSSLSPDLLRGNSDRFGADQNSLTIELPLHGVSSPTVLLVEQQPSSVLIGEEEWALENFRLPSRRSLSFAIFGGIGAIFCFGLTFSLGPGKVGG
jgi:hypothetical protein